MLEIKHSLNFLPLNWIGWIIYFLIPEKRSIAQKNIARVFGDTLSPQEKKRIVVAYYSHLFLCFKEIFLLPFLGKTRLEKRVKIIGEEHLHQALQKNKGAIILSGHFGNWEFAPLFILDKLKNEVGHAYCVRKSLRFNFLNDFFWGRFEKAGYKIINKNNALGQIRLILEKKNVVFVPFDIKPSRRSRSSVKVNFLGRLSNTYTSVAYLANKFECPVLSVRSYRVNKKKHIVEFYPEIQRDVYKDKEQAYLEDTKKYNHRLEEMLLASPEQWLWSYKRWYSKEQ
ncbi:lysophospholipid acyltransferase family protein [Legionella hackeliae]|nr:lysophospholipid acyltransferase family protein [Legionella hackeliae]KTD12729.1 WaaM [Legionella hackeliae]STX48937.1 WaaM [Legionella hackeliae]